MAKQTSINVQPVKGGSEEHNKRKKKLDYVRKDLSHLNEYWECDTQANRLANIKALYQSKTGQKMQAKATPIREGVVVIQESTTMADLHRLADAYRDRLGIEVFQIAIHRDEGYQKSKDWKPNLHAHLVFDWTNHSTGKSVKLNRQKMAEMQTITAEVLGMERGQSSEKKHLTAQQFKAAAEAQRAEQLKEQVAELSTAKTAKEATIDTFKTVGAHVVDAITGKTKRKEEGLKGEILRLKDELAKKEAEITRIKKEAQEALNSVRSRYESKVYGLQQDKQRAERWEKAAEANAERWRNRFFSLWPDAAAAIEAIVKRCTTMIRTFTTAHIASIEKALRNARSMDERKKYASDLWNMAKDEMPGTTPKAWIQEGKKDLDLLVEYGPEQYQKQERSRTQNRGMHL